MNHPLNVKSAWCKCIFNNHPSNLTESSETDWLLCLWFHAVFIAWSVCQMEPVKGSSWNNQTKLTISGYSKLAEANRDRLNYVFRPKNFTTRHKPMALSPRELLSDFQSGSWTERNLGREGSNQHIIISVNNFENGKVIAQLNNK